MSSSIEEMELFPFVRNYNVDIKFIPHDAFHPLRSTSTDLKAK